MALAAGGHFLLLFLVVTAMVHGGWTLELGNGTKLLRRGSFPAGFVFGAASAAYQYEGGAREGGKGASIWDTFAYEHPDKIADGSNGDVAIDSYHRYKEDVNIMKGMGLDAYRFSISWTRILPNGSLSGGVNKEGINYYNNLINDLISNGLLPWVTLFHWDSPQALEERYGGFLSQDIVEDFQDYAEVCFMEFGDRVKHWITFNEPASFCSQGYSTGSLAPGRCSPWGKGRCSAGDSGREPYIACHHQLLAHAAVVGLYRQKYQEKQGGRIGITLNCNWFVPYSGSKSNHAAAQRALDFVLGWFMDPLTRGNYPFIMRAFVRDRLPRFTEKQSEELKGSLDFIGINYYTTSYVYDVPPCNNASTSFITDARFELTAIRNGIPIGPKAASDWLYIYPPGIRKLLLYIKTKYNNPVIYITENGVDEFNNKTAPLEEALKDDTRINYHHNHLLYLRRAISDGVDVRGYFAWSLLDNFEWASGYTVRFGINFVDYKDGLKRYPKKSALWFHKFLGN